MAPLHAISVGRFAARELSVGFRSLARARQFFSTTPRSIAPRHLMSIADLSSAEFTTLVKNAAAHKAAVQRSNALAGNLSLALAGDMIAFMTSKRTTRTRVSTEKAIVLLGGHPTVLGKDDIHLGVNESIQDTAEFLSSMTAGLVARVGPHSDIVDLARFASVPVINGLSADFHPLQIIADFLTLHETFSSPTNPISTTPKPLSTTTNPRATLGLEYLKVAWIGDSNNVLFDLALACVKTGVDITVASPPGYGMPDKMRALIHAAAASTAAEGCARAGQLAEMTVPEEAVRDADIIVTDTWVSMGQEAETKARKAAFAGFRVSEKLASRGGARPTWRFMHCMPRHPDEVTDDVFRGPRSLVRMEAANRLWAAVAALEAFIINKGKIV